MGCCASKKNPSSVLPPPQPHNPDDEPNSEKLHSGKAAEKETEEKFEVAKKEVFLIHHRKSNDRGSEPKGSSPDSDRLAKSMGSSEPEISDPKSPASEAIASSLMAMAANGGIVRTSSCTRDEVDAILIQCGRLSRSSSGKGGVSGSSGKCSGSKRSHDFDRENEGSAEVICDGGAVDGDERHRRRQSRGSHGRRTPSRSRERDPQIQRSGSRERSSGGVRRVSRSPGRRSENPITTPATGIGGAASSTGSATSNDAGNRPGKMVAVPPTEKVNNGSVGDGAGNAGNLKRVPVKRNAMSPRSRSPAKPVVKGASEGHQNQPSLSRSSSRKAEHSPYRRTPLNELDMNKANPVNLVSQNKVKAAAEAPPPLMRSRCSRLSRDLDMNLESLLNPKPAGSYNSLLLEDIHNFHQKTNSEANPDAESSGVESTQGGDQESSGSNSYPLGRTSREPNSADSTDRWTSKSREEGVSFQRHALSSNRAQTGQVRTRVGARR